MKKNILILLLALVGIVAQAQIPNGYYNNADGKTGDELKIALHNIIKGHQEVSYAGLLNAFAYTDCKSNGKIWDIYSNIEYSPNSSICGNYDEEGDCWNREHTWPQSWFKEQSTPRTDLFHVYPTDGYVNGRRSSFPYGEVSNPTYTSGNGSKLGPCVTAGYTGTVFEPVDEYKGDIARSYFYMSVRYYSEDGSWITTDMTNKSVIKDWAMTMLLRWSDNDPVSEKEIARNEAVYGYQGNRNPFIDHPEYARMIWDPNYTPTTSYNITYASNLSNGSVSGPSSAAQGSTVAIVATPNAGYQVSGYSVYKTGDQSTTLSVSSNGTFTMPGYEVTVSATFAPNNTYYDIALGSVSHGSISANTYSAKSGTTINLTATPETGYHLYSWYVYKTGDMSTTVPVSGNSFTMPSFNVTVNASFSNQNTGGNYEKVTSNLSDWSGDYLIVYETGSKAFNGALTNLDVANNNISVTISSDAIPSNTTTDVAKFTIASMTGGYSIKAASGKYIGNAGNSNSLTSSDSPLANTISYTNGTLNIVSSGGAYLRFNKANDQQRFRYYKSSSYTDQQTIQLYKKTSGITPTHKVHFNSNGGAGSMNDQTVNEMEAATLTANTFTRNGFEFDGWNTQANGQGQYYADQATVYLTDDITLYAQWNPKYSVTVVQVANGTISADPTSAVEETNITLTATPELGYEFDHWIVTDANDNAITVIENQFEMPASNITVNATFMYVGLPFTQKYHLVTSADQLVAGRTYLIVNTEYNKALGKTQNTNNRSAAAVTIENNVITTLGDACELTLGGETGAWTFYDATNNSGYLYAAGGSNTNNYLKTQTTLTNAGKWTISLNNNKATIKTIDLNVNRHTIMYNNSSSIFSCYASGQKDVYLFIRSEEISITQNTTEANIFPFDKHIVSSGTILTVTGTVTCDDPNNLIIEDGAQFIHHNDGVKATVKKNIEGYAGNSGWYTIATPFTSYTPNSEIVSDNYDLYAYDEDGEKEWVNYKSHSQEFTMTSGDGYLYAHNPTTTLRMTGTLNNGDYSQTVNLSYANAHESIRGYNLIGNPTARDITFTRKTSDISDGYYYVSNGDAWIYTTSNTVPAGLGFLVKANATDQRVELNPSSKREDSQVEGEYLCINVDGEKAYVKMNEGVSMPLFAFNGNSSNLYLTHEGKPYIMLVRDGAESIDLNYHSSHKGQHSLSVAAEDLGLDYLHLIDHLTGADIDLLVTPTYSFESEKHDYDTRFLLQFAPANNDVINSDFAYCADGQIHIMDVKDSSTLQIVDLTGRVIISRDGACTVSTEEITPGVYTLRLITPENIRTQKIIVMK